MAANDSHNGANIPYGRYQGVYVRFRARYSIAMLPAVLIVVSALHMSLTAFLTHVWIDVLLLAFCEVWFTRRLGVTIGERGLTLHYAFHRRLIPWARMRRSFPGRGCVRWSGSAGATHALNGSGSRPTMAKPYASRYSNAQPSLASSPRLSASMCLHGGRELDALATLQRALSEHTAASELRSSTTPDPVG
jgi:hypothetical protein